MRQPNNSPGAEACSGRPAWRRVAACSRQRALILWLLLAAGAAPAADLRTGNAAPDFEIRDLDGKVHARKELAGKPAVLVFGETYNQNTLSALTNLDAILAAGKLSEDTIQTVLVVGARASSGKIRLDLARVNYGGKLLVLHDKSRAVFEAYGIKVLPTTFVVDGKGRISLGVSGYPLSYADMIADGVLYALGKIERDRLDAALNPTNRSGLTETQLKALRTARMARALAKRKLNDVAMEYFKKAISLDPKLVEARVGLARCLLSLGRVQEAEPQYAEALRLSPESDEAVAGLARIEIRRGQLDQAEKRLKERLAVHPMNSELHFLVGEASEKRGDKDAALAAYKRAAQLMLERVGDH